MIHEAKTLLITDSDMDGLGSAVLSKAFDINYDKIELSVPYKMNTTEMIKLVNQYDEITVADLSFNEEIMNELSHKNITVYDHHITSAYLNNSKYEGSISDSSRCGTKLYFEEVVIKKYNRRVNKSAIEFVELVDTYDRWQKQSPRWEEACKLNRLYLYYKNYPWEFIQYFAEKIMNDDFGFNSKDEENSDLILKDIKNSCEEAGDKLKIFTDKRFDVVYDDVRSNGIPYGVSYFNQYVSEVGNYLIEQYKLAYVILIEQSQQVGVSLRSIPEFNCTSFKNIKGHKNAAGGRFNKQFTKGVYEGVLLDLL